MPRWISFHCEPCMGTGGGVIMPCLLWVNSMYMYSMYMCSMYMLWVNSMHLIKNQPDRNCAHTVMVGFL